MPRLNLFRRSRSITIGLRCLDCGKTFKQRAERLFYDLGTVERKQQGEQVPFSAFFVQARVICPHCQAEDRYDLSNWQYLRVILAIIMNHFIPPGPDSWFQSVYLGTEDGRIMHPFELRVYYADRVARNPQKADLRLQYANILRSQGWATEAEDQYRAVLNLAPRQTEALINLAALLAQRGEQEEALDYLRLLTSLKPKNEKQREQVTIAQEVLNGTLHLDELIVGNPVYPKR